MASQRLLPERSVRGGFDVFVAYLFSLQFADFADGEVVDPGRRSYLRRKAEYGIVHKVICCLLKDGDGRAVTWLKAPSPSIGSGSLNSFPTGESVALYAQVLGYRST